MMHFDGFVHTLLYVQSAEDDISIDNYLKYLDRFSREARDFCKTAPTSRLSEPSGLDLYTTS